MMPFSPPHAAAPAIDVLVQSPLWNVQPLAEQTARAAIAAAATTISTKNGELSIVLTDDSAVRALNRQWRGLDKPTNVLSFPGRGIDDGPHLFGDIVIAYETLKRECDDDDKDFLHHLAHLTVHGFLHLMGYDHTVDAEAEEMEALESRIMLSMNLPDPWLGHELDHDFGEA
jgi:probable rRNA maturation factor